MLTKCSLGCLLTSKNTPSYWLWNRRMIHSLKNMQNFLLTIKSWNLRGKNKCFLEKQNNSKIGFIEGPSDLK